MRIEFWDDEIDMMSSFQVDTQRRQDPVAEVTNPPARAQAIAAGVVAACKAPLKYMGQVIRGDPRAGVSHGNDGVLAFQSHAKGDHAVRGCKGEGIVTEILQCNAQAVPGSLDQNRVCRKAQAEGKTGHLHIRTVGLVKLLQMVGEVDCLG